jgi:hypothetical protein
MAAQDTASNAETRGKSSWKYIYVMMGFALAIEGNLIEMVTPLAWPCNLISYVLVGCLTVYLFTSNGWFQNKLIGIKARYENRPR